jgi:LPS-assembly lipoprotein
VSTIVLARPADLRQTAAMTRPLTLRFPLLRPFVLVLLALALSACGFHLRDALLLPPDLGPLRVVSPDPYSPLAQSLSEALARAGATPAAEGATDDVATLRVVSERWGSTPLSVDQFGRAQEYTLRYAVIFRLNRADGSDLVPQQAIELSRDYISVPTNASGAEGEREILPKELRREMVASILRRIDAASRAPVAAAPAAEPAGPAPEPAPAPTP